MDDIQSWWEVPSIAHFCSLFRAAFNLLDFDIEELEEALLTDGAEDTGSSLLQELIVRLLCGCVSKGHEITISNYQMYLRRLFRKKCKEYCRPNPFNTDMDLRFIPLRTKVEILHALCDFRLDGEDVQELLKNLESDSLRVEALGQDKHNSNYWYFYGTRLYKEEFPKIQKKKNKEKKRGRGRHSSESDDGAIPGPSVWSVVCYTEQDWETLTTTFQDSSDPAEKSLYCTLFEDFLPEIPRLFSEKERLQMKRRMEYQPRRTSSRLNKLNKQKEAAAVQDFLKESDSEPEGGQNKQQKRRESDNEVDTRQIGRQKRRGAHLDTESDSEIRKKRLEEEEDAGELVRKKVIKEESEDSEETENVKLKNNNKKRVVGEGSGESDLELKKRVKYRGGGSDCENTAGVNNKQIIHKRRELISEDDTQSGGSGGRSKKKDRIKKSLKGCDVSDGEGSEESPASTTRKRVTRTQKRSSPSPVVVPTPPLGRQTNNSLACATGPIFIQSTAPAQNPVSSNRKLRSSQVFAQSEEDLQTGMYKILDRLKNHPDAWPFSEPVEEEYAPRYYAIVNKPMDLDRMETRLDSGRYQTFSEFKADFKLIVENCKKYNGSKNEYTDMVENLELEFERLSKRYLEVDFSSDEEIAIQFPTVPSPKVPSRSPSPIAASPVSQDRSSRSKTKKGKHHHRNKKRRRHETSQDEHDTSPEPEQRPETPEKKPTVVPQPVGPYGRRRAGPLQSQSSRRLASRKAQSEASGSLIEEEASDGDRENVQVGIKREAPSQTGNARKRKKGRAKGSAEIEALDIATEKTLRDINKWLDDTPRFSELTSPSNSPSHYSNAGEDYGRSGLGHHIGATVDEDKRPTVNREKRRAKPSNTSTLEALKGRTVKKDVQRTTDRLQPGKSKGNLIANLPKESTVGDAMINPKLIKKEKEAVVSTDEPKLSLGSVLSSIGGFTEKKVVVEDVKQEVTSQVQEVKVEVKEEEKPSAKPVADTSKATPNLSAWFKAFGAPKTAPVKKKADVEAVKPEVSKQVVPEPEIFQSPERAPRHRNLSTGSSVSDRSSAFSQDIDDITSPRDRLALHQSPPAMSPTSPRHPPPQPQHFPLNGSIKVGFYQDTSSQKNSPDKGSPRGESPQVPTPQTTPTYPQYTPPRSYPTISNPTPTYEAPAPVTPPQFTPTTQPPITYAQSADIQYYDTSKPLTDQYRDRQPTPPKVTEAPPSPQIRQDYPRPPTTNVPILSHDFSKMQPNYTQPSTPYHLNTPNPAAMRPMQPVLIQPSRNMPNNLIMPPAQPDPKVMQQYPVKKRMVYSNPEYPSVDLSYQNQRMVPPIGLSTENQQRLGQSLSLSAENQQRIGLSTENQQRLGQSLSLSAENQQRIGLSTENQQRLGQSISLSTENQQRLVQPMGLSPDNQQRLVATPISLASENQQRIGTPIGLSTENQQRLVPPIGLSTDNQQRLVPPIGLSTDNQQRLVPPIGLSTENQRLVPPPIGLSTYYDPNLLPNPAYDLSAMKETTPQPPVTKSKRGRKKSTPIEPPKVPDNLGTAFQHYVGLNKDALKASVPGSAFNFGTPGLTLPSSGIYNTPSDKDAAYYAQYRNYYDKQLKTPQTQSTQQQNQQCISGPTSPQSPFAFLGQPSTGSRPPQYQQNNSTEYFQPPTQMDQKAAAVSYYHQQLASTFGTAPPYSPSNQQNNQQGTQPATRSPFMMESSQLYQQYFQREDFLQRPSLLHQSLLPTGYPHAPPYHPSLGIRQPFDRPSWL